MTNRSRTDLKMVDRAWGFIISSTLVSIIVGSNLIQATYEGDALHIIKEALHAEVNWTGNDPCQAWQGVSCFLNHVIGLSLSTNGLHGTLPAEIGQLSFLESLDLSNNRVEGNIPIDIANLTNLRTLKLDGNKQLSGPLPSSIGQLLSVKFLNLHDAEMHGNLPPEFGSLHKITNLTLQSNFLTGTLPQSWSSMVNIRHLSVFNNLLSGPLPSWISRFSTKFNLGCNYFIGPKPTGFPEPLIWGNCFDSNVDIHMKSCLGSPGCVSFYSQPENAHYGYRLQRGKKSNIGVVVGPSLCGFIMLVVIFVGLRALKIRKIRKRHLVNLEVLVGHPQRSTDVASNTAEPWDVPNGIRRFDLEEILKATEHFNKARELGCGGFGRVYKGYLGNGCVVAAKRASPSSIQGQKQFQNEIVTLSRLHHRCLVKLEGFCEEAGEQVLVYEFMKNGNLDGLIWDERKRATLGWYKRIEIAIAVAQGLDYLHSFADPPIIHRDIKPSNILLDEHLNAKLSDFGISRSTTDFINTYISTGPAGTVGYVDPHYFLRKHLTLSSDVYSYGVVLLVLITGQKAIDHDRVEEVNLVEWVKAKSQKDDLESIIDSHLLVREKIPQSFRTVTELALKCAAFERSERPTISEVVNILGTVLKNETTYERRKTDPSFDEDLASSSITQRSFQEMDSSLTGR